VEDALPHQHGVVVGERSGRVGLDAEVRAVGTREIDQHHLRPMHDDLAVEPGDPTVGRELQVGPIATKREPAPRNSVRENCLVHVAPHNQVEQTHRVRRGLQFKAKDDAPDAKLVVGVEFDGLLPRDAHIHAIARFVVTNPHARSLDDEGRMAPREEVVLREEWRGLPTDDVLPFLQRKLPFLRAVELGDEQLDPWRSHGRAYMGARVFDLRLDAGRAPRVPSLRHRGLCERRACCRNLRGRRGHLPWPDRARPAHRTRSLYGIGIRGDGKGIGGSTVGRRDTARRSREGITPRCEGISA